MQYLRNHTPDHHDKHIDTKVYPLRVQSWKAQWKSSSNVWDTWQNAKEGKLSFSKTKRDRSRSVEQLRSSFFLESIGFFLVTSSIEWKAIRAAITTENGCSLRDAGPQPRIDRYGERVSLSWWTSNDRYSLSSRRILTNKVSPFRWGKGLSIGTFLLKIRAKMTPQRRFEPSTTISRNLTGPALKTIKRVDIFNV